MSDAMTPRQAAEAMRADAVLIAQQMVRANRDGGVINAIREYQRRIFELRLPAIPESGDADGSPPPPDFPTWRDAYEDLLVQDEANRAEIAMLRAARRERDEARVSVIGRDAEIAELKAECVELRAALKTAWAANAKSRP
jgi:hypothetical protein